MTIAIKSFHQICYCHKKNVMIINAFNNGNTNIANLKTQHRQIMTTVTNKILKFQPKTKLLIDLYRTFFTGIIFIIPSPKSMLL